MRTVTGPFHRRRTVIEEDQNASLPPLPPPWTDERWFRGGFPPREHNRLEPLVDGDAYFGDLYTALLSARERVTICAWCLTPRMPIRRGELELQSIFAEVLREVSTRAEVYILLWSGAPALFEPTERMVEDVRDVLRRIAPRVRCELDRRALFSHDHHQKAITIDGRIAYVGGMDISTFQGDRWDTQAHLLRFGPNWHDVQVRLEGDVVVDVEENFCQRWNAVTGQEVRPLSPVPPQPSWDTPAQIVRTVPAGRYPVAERGEFGIHHALTTAIRKAERFVYLENQYIWSPEIVDALLEAMNRPRPGPFRAVLVLPARAYTGKYDNDEHVRLLASADEGKGQFHAYSLWTGGPAAGATGFRYLPIYVHAKVSVVDDEWFSVGSANLNGRGLATDTEMNVHSIAPVVARSLRTSLWAEHLGMPIHQVAQSDPISLIDEAWPAAAAAMEQAIRSSTMPPLGTARRYVPGGNPVSRLLDLFQEETLEH